MLIRLLCFLFISTLTANNISWEKYKEKVLSHQNKVWGWCTQDKATRLMDLIYDTHPSTCVEIGVFGGSSIYPTACALKYQRQGVVWAIDPWTSDCATEGYDPGNANYEWWSNLDYEQVYQHFEYIRRRFKIVDYSKVLRMTSQEALPYFEDSTIDILHIDGNHSELSALHDAQMWYPKIKPGGYIWFDDTLWSTTGQGFQYLIEQGCILIDQTDDKNCCLLRKPELIPN
jgi:hypothetical protein